MALNYISMTTLFGVVAFLIPCKGFSQTDTLTGSAAANIAESGICGRIKKYSVGPSKLGKVVLEDGREVPNLDNLGGNQAFYAIAMVNKLTVCFEKGGGIYPSYQVESFSD